MKYYKLIFILLFFQSCDVSTFSDKEASDLSNLKVNVLITDGTKSNSLQNIKLYLTDGKKQIINENIKILLNDSPLDLFVKQELYYTKNSFYRTDDLTRKNSYYFEIVLPDSTKHPLAFIKPLKRSDSTKFNIPKTSSRNEDLILKWENINSLTNMEIWKLVHQKNKPNMHSGGRYAETTIKDTINTKNGKYMVSKSFFKDSLTVADYLKIRLSYMENGLVNPKLLINSKVSYTYVIEETINLEE